MTEKTEMDQIRSERMGSLTRRMEEAEHDLARLLRDSQESSQRFTALSQQLGSIAGQIERSESSRKAKIEAYKAYLTELDTATKRLLDLGKHQLKKDYGGHSEAARKLPEKTIKMWQAAINDSMSGRSRCLHCARGARLLVMDRPHVTCTVLQDFIVHPNREGERRSLAKKDRAGDLRVEPEKFFADVPPVKACDRFLGFEDE